MELNLLNWSFQNEETLKKYAADCQEQLKQKDDANRTLTAEIEKLKQK